MTEADTRANYIDPALKSTGWNKSLITREYYFTDGRKLAGQKRGSRCFVDYLLHKGNHFLAIIEAKKESEHPTKGLQQAIDYAKKLEIRFVYSSNGTQIYEMDLKTGSGNYIDTYPTPDELLDRITGDNTSITETLRNTPFQLESGKTPRYYQELAVHAATDAIGNGTERVLLTLATGTGKTFIAFQIVHKLFQSRWNRQEFGARRPRILFLADRNILADQAINTFNPYENDLIKIDGDEVRRRNGEVPTNAHIFFAIYQALAERKNAENEDIGGYYKKYPSDFFDLILIDECHRGGAKNDGSWRDILDHFSPAVHLGLTATPKRTDNVDTYSYFGEPVYEYSLKDGINDGFLTPYRVKRVRTNLDELVLTGSDLILKGEAKKDLYEVKDYDTQIIADERTELVAKEILKQINALEKTIIFCVNQDHALTMRDMINKHKAAFGCPTDPHYCVRVTSDEGKTGRELLEKFQDNDKDIPTILTSSQMLTTGVDARNVRNIVLDRNIGSMVEFKQIVGRGTRVFDGKDYFTIIDFRGATNLFYDKDWDGDPEEPEPKQPRPPSKPGEEPDGNQPPIVGEPDPLEKEKLTVSLSPTRQLKVIDVEIRYIDDTGRPLTAQQFVEQLMFKLPQLFSSVEELREIWSHPDKREDFIIQLAQHGFDSDQLKTLRAMFEAEACDLFDILTFLSHEKPLRKRSERVLSTKQNTTFFSQYPHADAQAFLEFILFRYEMTGIDELSRKRLNHLIEQAKLGTLADLKQAFGGSPKDVLDAFLALQHVLYHCA
ncbi:EcoAI/FtnUII family type I restriction enzme subunit R [Rubritalea tangerina]|uniref:EcoAI/FtnUII family type I restriction enzme subunit R n=1 Tax=Rubritalea tangerina TaxID=430798 RepID=A0ABW4ZG75_9BACT